VKSLSDLTKVFAIENHHLKQESIFRLQNIILLGSGVSGISAAYHIRKHGSADIEVVLFEECQEKIGGHANTVAGNRDGMPHSVDAGSPHCVF